MVGHGLQSVIVSTGPHPPFLSGADDPLKTVPLNIIIKDLYSTFTTFFFLISRTFTLLI